MPMTTLLTVPASLEEIIRNYDVKDDPFTVSDIARELTAARSAMIARPCRVDRE